MRLDSRTAKDIMTQTVATLDGETTLRDAAQFLNDHHISGAPVVDEDNTVVGILCEADLISEARKRAALPRIAAFGLFLASEESLQRIYHDGETLLVREIMSTDVRTLPPDASVAEIGELFSRRKVNRVPIVDEHQKLLGIVTREDLLRAIFHLDDAPGATSDDTEMAGGATS